MERRCNNKDGASKPLRHLSARLRLWLPESDPFRRTSWLFLVAVGLVSAYTFAALVVSPQTVLLRISAALSLVVLGRLWYLIHRDDCDLPFLVPFEALGIFTVGLGTGGILHVLGLTFGVLYFRAVRGGVRSAMLKSTTFAVANFAVLSRTPPMTFSATDVFVQAAIAMQLVAITNALLGRGLKRAGRDQVALAEAHEQVGLSHRLLSEAERVAGFGSWQWDAATSHVRISEGMRDIAGFDSLILTGREWTSRLHPDDRARVNHSMVNVLSGAQPVASVEFRIVVPHLGVGHVIMHARRLLDDAGSIVGAVGTVHDITHYRQLDIELARQQELSEMKSRFLSTVSHELRTPLTSLIGFTETLLNDDWDPQTRVEFLTLMQEQGAELHSLIEDLITFGRAEAGELTLSQTRVDFGSEAAAVVAGLGERSGGIIVDVPPGTWLNADPLRVRQIIRNLVDNALKYGAAPVTITARFVEGGVSCQVSDSGGGIAEADAETIFEPYRRLVDDRTMSLPGVGLGLPLCRMLAERQDGSLRYVLGAPQPTFELILPAA